MDTPSLVLLDRQHTAIPIGAVAPGIMYPLNGSFNISGWSTLCIDVVLDTAVAGNQITVTWFNNFGTTNDEIYPIPVTAAMGQNNSFTGGITFHQIRIPIKARACSITVVNPAGIGAQDLTSLRVWATDVSVDMQAEYLAASRDVVIAGLANANLVSGLQTGVIIRPTGTINIGRTVATAVMPINAGETLIYEMKGNIIAVNPGAAAVTVHVIETRV
jgi:hypothetical protein